jgi:putative tryptophan/tyrosine transport system substrate-binding protein
VLALRKGLQSLGWIEGTNLRINYYWGAGNPDQALALVNQLLSDPPDVILVNGTPALSAVKQATQRIPVVFAAVTDPVGGGFVKSLARPRANITGFSTFEAEIGSKWLELLNQISPRLQRVAILEDPDFQGFAAVTHTIEQLAPTMGMRPINLAFHNPGENLESSISSFVEDQRTGLIVLPTPTNTFARAKILFAAARYQLPAIYPFRFYATDGGLMSYGFEPSDLFFRSASYVDRILKGENPSDLPVQAPVKYELLINLKTAKTLGLKVPSPLLSIADEVIE